MISFNSPYLTGSEYDAIRDVFESNSFYGAGKFTASCEEKIASILNCNDVMLTDSCTSALEMVALLLRNFEIEQEVIVPSYTFSSTAAAFARAGYKVKFCEVDPQTMSLDLEHVKRLTTSKTVAVVPVHYGGLPASIKELVEFAKDTGVAVVEDAAQAFGTKLDGQPLGTFGDFGCFSFHETKNLHCGLGGALVVNDQRHSDRARHIWERGTNRQEVLKGVVDKYSWVEIGGSFYPTELQAAFLSVQLDSFHENIFAREEIYNIYLSSLNSLRSSGVLSFPGVGSNVNFNFHAFFVLAQSEMIADKLRDYLKRVGISAYIGYVPLHSSPVGLRMGYKPDSLPVTEVNAAKVVRLPLHNCMTAEDAQRVANRILEFFDKICQISDSEK